MDTAALHAHAAPQALRVLLTDNLRVWNGQSYGVLMLGMELKRRGHRVLVLTLPDSDLEKRALAAGLESYTQLELRRGLRPASILRDLAASRALLRSFDPDVIVTSGSPDTWRLVVARRLERHRASTVRWRHNTLRVRKGVASRWLHRSGIDHLALGSMAIAKHYAGLVEPERITLFPYSADLAAFRDAPRTGATQASLGLPASATLVTAVGRLSWEKDFATLIRAWSLVASRFHDAHLVIVGEGGERPALGALATELGVAASVHLVGFRKDIPAIYADSELVALTPIDGESFGIVLLEACAAARACVATDVGGVGELVVDGETGRLVPPGDAPAVAEAIAECLADPVLRERYGRRGQERVLTRFTHERLGDQAESLFRSLRSSRAGS